MSGWEDMIGPENDCGNDQLRFMTEVGVPMTIKSMSDNVLDLMDLWNSVGIFDAQDVESLGEVKNRLDLLLSALTARKVAA